MAHIMKLKHAQVGGNLLAHIERTRGDRSNYGNMQIDKSRTHLNYSLADGHKWEDGYKDGWEAGKRFRENWEILSRQQKRKPRADIVGLGSVVITLPEEYKNAPPNIKAEFFQSCHEFLHSRYGSRGNEIYSEVHMDETTPHIHYGFIPVTREGKISAKEVLNRSDFQKFHSDLDRHLGKSLEWYRGGVRRDSENPRQYIEMEELKSKPQDYRKRKEQALELQKTLSKQSILKKTVKLSPNEQETVKELISSFESLSAGHELLDESKKRDSDSRQTEISLAKRGKELIQREYQLQAQQEKFLKIIEEYKKQNKELNQLKNSIQIVRNSMIEILARNPKQQKPETRTPQIERILQVFRDLEKPILKMEVQKKKEELNPSKKEEQILTLHR